MVIADASRSRSRHPRKRGAATPSIRQFPAPSASISVTVVEPPLRPVTRADLVSHEASS
nr:hypothetical protein [Actinomadura madurae]